MRLPAGVVPPPHHSLPLPMGPFSLAPDLAGLGRGQGWSHNFPFKSFPDSGQVTFPAELQSAPPRQVESVICWASCQGGGNEGGLGLQGATDLSHWGS